MAHDRARGNRGEGRCLGCGQKRLVILAGGGWENAILFAVAYVQVELIKVVEASRSKCPAGLTAQAQNWGKKRCLKRSSADAR